MDNHNHKLELYFTRDFSLCTADFWHDLLAIDFKREFGVGIDKQVMRFNGRALEAYRDIEEMEQVENYILSKGLDNLIFSEESFYKFKSDVDQVVELLERVSSKDFTAMINNFQKSVELFHAFYPYVAFSNFLPSRWRDKLFSMYPKQAQVMADRWYKAREFSEGKFEKIDYYWRDLIAIFLSKQGLDPKFAHLVRFQELNNLVKGSVKFELAEIIKRKQGYILYQNNFMLNKEFMKFLEENNFIYKDIEIGKFVESFAGQVASRGELVKGQVQIVLNINEVKDFQAGNILVTSMTVPDFVPAMNKAKAILTDEGGITCHAAIVSRELGKPCIIGTKIATKVLKDGDIIEIDTQTGVIKVIQK